MTSKFLAAALAALLSVSLAAIAAPDEAQRQAIERVMAAKAKLKQAQAATGNERSKLMDEHMKMMKETMDKMKGMKPRADMSMKEHEQWMEEHQKLMQQMMDQMMTEHHMMMDQAGAKKAPAADKDGEGEHKH